MATWGDSVAKHLLNISICPRCSSKLNRAGHCINCGADLSGDLGKQIWEASSEAAIAIRAREALIATIPPKSRSVREASQVPAGPFTSAPTAPVVGTARDESISIQSVMAVAGAGLLGVAAIVFTFFNPELSDFATRTTIIGLTTLVFLGGAWFLARVGLQFSAESVGALGVVFVGLDIWALTESSPVTISGWWLVAAGTLVGAIALVALARLARIRSWLLAGIIGISLAPAFVGYAMGGAWLIITGHVVMGFTALALHGLLSRLSPRFDRKLALESRLLGALQWLSIVLVVGGVGMTLLSSSDNRALPASTFALLLAVLALLSARYGSPRAWSFVAGALAVGGIALVPLATAADAVWMLALIPSAAAVALAGAAALPLPATVRRDHFRSGAWIPLLVTTLPAATLAGLEMFAPLGSPLDTDMGLATALGVSAGALGSAALAAIARRRDPESAVARGSITMALWLGALATVSFELWSALGPVARVGLAVAVAIGSAALLLRAVTGWTLSRRMPLLVLAHLSLFFAAAAGWFEPSISVASGVAVAAALLLVSRTVAPWMRPLHVGASFAWILATIAHGLSLAGVESIAVLCLTTTIASLGALTATLVRRVPAGAWYAILIVTSVPFLLGVGSVVAERSGWTALSTGVTFLLAATLVTTRRPGLNRGVRTLAAALLVPALAVVVVCLGAQVLLVSASPITLPIIAAIVAIALPSTPAIGRALIRRGVTDPDARAACIAIEVSSLITASIAVLLALVRAAAGLGTSFTVLVILGIGALAAGLLTRRRYAWAVSGASFTGALWSLWALFDVRTVEAYVLPPALGMALVGALLVWRVQRGRELYFVGLLIAIGSSVGLIGALGLSDSGGSARVIGTTVAAGLLFAAGVVGPRRLGSLRLMSLIVALCSTAGLVLLAIRFGLDLEPSVRGLGAAVMLPVLALSALAVVIAGAAGRGIASIMPRRWVYVPAVVFAIAGPIVAIREGWLPILTVLALSLALLGLMIVTVVRARTRAVTLPPVWFTFAAALATAIASWSQRELRVEAYSLPLGIALIGAGVLASGVEGPGTRTSWPIGFRGSWQLLAPGILVTLVPSVLATGTDPRTERAILVIALALAAILIGSIRKLAAPFILGVITLPIENLVVFVVQIGRSIGAAPWWITLATAGAVLLVIAVTSERKASGMRGVSARLRDLS